MDPKMEKDSLLQLLLEKTIISKVEDYDDLTKPQLEGLLENGMALIAVSQTIEEANRNAVQALKDEFLEDKDTFVQSIAIENKRLKQQANSLILSFKGKIKEFAKLLDEPFK